jgi:predicted ATPase
LIGFTHSIDRNSQLSELNISVSLNTNEVSKLAPGSILIVPLTDNWNNFGHQSRVKVFIRLSAEDQIYEFLTHIGFVVLRPGEKNGVRLITEYLEGNAITRPITADDHMFSMLFDMESYREIVARFKPSGAKLILRAMGDLVAIKEFKLNKKLVELAEKTDIFIESFVRSSESYYTYKNAGSILRGLKKENVKRPSQSIGISFRLPGREADHNLKFHFDHHAPLPKRIAIVIGKNGVGKSQTLGRIVKAALVADKKLVDIESGERPEINRLLAFAPTNEAKSAFPSERGKQARIWYRRFALNRSTSSATGEGVSDVIVQVARSQESIATMSRWEIFTNAVKAIDNWGQIALPTKKGTFLALEKLMGGGEQTSLKRYSSINEKKDPVRLIEGKGYPLSSGEISFLRFAAQVSLHIENGSLLLLDEPETHLHPNFISQLVALLDSLLEKTGSSAIIATHSVYFVREVFPAQVTVLRINEGGNVITERPALSTFGANVGAISYFVFGEDELSKLATRLKTRLLKKFRTWDELYAQYKDELSLEMLGELREAIEERGNK